MQCIVNNNNRQALLVEESFKLDNFENFDIGDISAENLIGKFPSVQEWILIPTEETRDVMEDMRIKLHLKNKATRIKARDEATDVFLKKFGLL